MLTFVSYSCPYSETSRIRTVNDMAAGEPILSLPGDAIARFRIGRPRLIGADSATREWNDFWGCLLA